MKYKYNRKQYVSPIYDGEIVYFETALLFDNEKEKAMLYPIDEIISVNNYGLDKEYVRFKDYDIKDGKLIILDGSDIPSLDIDSYYRKQPNDEIIKIAVSPEISLYKFNEDRFMYYGELDTFTKLQIAVTYRHSKTWDGPKPIYQGQKLQHFFAKLEKKEQTTVVWYGDSITVGCNSSGTEYGGNTLPNAESFQVMVTKTLEDRYNTKINYVNTAVGGMNSDWGRNNFKERVSDYKPDLVFIGFGMNDGWIDPKEHTMMIKQIVDGVKKDNPNCEFVIYSTTVANKESMWYSPIRNGYIDEYKRVFPDCALVDMTNMHEYLLTKKAFRDMTGNNVNHPNDFLARIYAQMILGTILD